MPAASISQTIAAIRRQRIPVHTIGFGREHPDKDVEITDAVVPARALPRIASSPPGHPAELRTLRQQGASSPSATAARCWPRRKSRSRNAASCRPRLVVFNGGARRAQDPRNLASTRSRGEENQPNNKVTRLVNVEKRATAHPLYRGRAALGVQVHPPRARRLPDIGIELPTMLRTTAEQDLPAGRPHDPQGTGRRLSRPSPRSFSLPGPDHRQRRSELLHRHASSS